MCRDEQHECGPAIAPAQRVEPVRSLHEIGIAKRTTDKCRTASEAQRPSRLIASKAPNDIAAAEHVAVAVQSRAGRIPVMDVARNTRGVRSGKRIGGVGCTQIPKCALAVASIVRIGPIEFDARDVRDPA